MWNGILPKDNGVYKLNDDMVRTFLEGKCGDSASTSLLGDTNLTFNLPYNIPVLLQNHM